MTFQLEVIDYCKNQILTAPNWSLSGLQTSPYEYYYEGSAVFIVEHPTKELAECPTTYSV